MDFSGVPSTSCSIMNSYIEFDDCSSIRVPSIYSLNAWCEHDQDFYSTTRPEIHYSALSSIEAFFISSATSAAASFS